MDSKLGFQRDGLKAQDYVPYLNKFAHVHGKIVRYIYIYIYVHGFYLYFMLNYVKCGKNVVYICFLHDLEIYIYIYMNVRNN